MARRFYTAEEKQLAIGVINRHGGEITRAAMVDIRAMLDAPKLNKSTVSRWKRAVTVPVATGLQPEKNAAIPVDDAADGALDDAYENVTRAYLEHALKEETINKMKGRDAVIAAATATDKMRLLRGLPTEIVTVTHEFVTVAQEAGLNPGELMNALIVEIRNSQAAQVVNHDE